MSNASPPLDYAAPRPSQRRSPERSFFVYLAIALAAGLLIAIVSLLYWRSLHNSAHTALLIVEGDANYDGAVVLVESTGGTTFQKSLEAGAQYNCRFILPPGVYVVKVRHEGRVIRQTPPTRIGDFQTGTLLLKGTPIQPATSPALTP